MNLSLSFLVKSECIHMTLAIDASWSSKYYMDVYSGSDLVESY